MTAAKPVTCENVNVPHSSHQHFFDTIDTLNHSPRHLAPSQMITLIDSIRYILVTFQYTLDKTHSWLYYGTLA